MWRLVLACAVCWASIGAAQTKQPPTPPKAAVRLYATNPVVQWGQPLLLPVALVNEGTEGFYVAKEFTEAGGGIAGFYYNINQLTGEPGTVCAGASDMFLLSPDKRPAEQVLKEDYLYLPPRAFVGFELSLTCELPNPGKYRIEVLYSAQDLNNERVATQPGLKAPVLVGSTEKIAIEIEVRRPSAQKQGSR